LRSISTAHIAVEALVKRQILVRDPKGVIKFDSPFFKHWCATQGAQP